MNAQLKTSDTIITEACDWIARLETGELSAADKLAFSQWMQDDPRHVAEIRLLANMSSDLERLADAPMQKASLDIDEAPRDARQPRSWRSAPWVAVSGIAATVLVAVSLLFQPVTNDTNGFLETSVGGYFEKELSDGSLVRLNTDTSLTVSFDEQARMIHLHKGELYLQVAHDTQRPLVVRADGRQVRAVGTAFAVRRSSEQLQVMVTEGIVAVAQGVTKPPNTPGSQVTASLEWQTPAPVLLQAGQIYEETQQGAHTVTRVDAKELERRLAWSRGLVEFTDTSLAEMVEEVSRYTELNITIQSDELRDIKFGGIFPTGETHLLLDVLESEYGVTVTYVDDLTVALTAN